MLTLVVLHFFARRGALWHFLQFCVHALILGALLFSVAPTILDILAKNQVLPASMQYGTAFGPSLYLFAFTIFVNIHHYFVDNVLWRKDNPSVKQYVFGQR